MFCIEEKMSLPREETNTKTLFRDAVSAEETGHGRCSGDVRKGTGPVITSLIIFPSDVF